MHRYLRTSINYRRQRGFSPLEIRSLNKFHLTAYADDILITASTRQSLIDTFQQLKSNSMEVGLIINEKKTRYLKSTKKPEMKA